MGPRSERCAAGRPSRWYDPLAFHPASFSQDGRQSRNDAPGRGSRDDLLRQNGAKKSAQVRRLVQPSEDDLVSPVSVQM